MTVSFYKIKSKTKNKIGRTFIVVYVGAEDGRLQSYQ